MKLPNLKNLICVNVNNPSGQYLPFSLRFVENITKRLLRQREIRQADISVSFVSDRAMRKLNAKYLAKKRPTDVLAFDLRLRGGYLIADIVVSVDTARTTAKKLKVSFAQELCRYVTHGMLHLLGYDDHTTSEKKRMWARQEFLLSKLLEDR